MGWRTTLTLAFQSIGIVYGDIGTSPLYVYASTFTSGIKNNDDILGVLSLIIYTIVLIPMLKYVFIVLWANDNGNGKISKFPCNLFFFSFISSSSSSSFFFFFFFFVVSYSLSLSL